MSYDADSMNQKALISLHSSILIPDDERSVAAVNPENVTAFNHEIAGFGYTFDGGALKRLNAMDWVGFNELRLSIIRAMIDISGAGATHRTLFNHFPYETPEQKGYLNRRTAAYLKDALRLNIADGQLLSCGHVLDPELFDAKEFGVCPVCQFEVDELKPAEMVLADFKRLTPLRMLQAVDIDGLSRKAGAMLARPSSLSLEERKFLLGLKEILDFKGSGALPAIPAKVARENLPLVFAFHGVEGVKPHLISATDVLRIAVLLSDQVGDLSLAEPVKFKLSTSRKKQLLSLIDAVAHKGNVMADMLRWRERWLRLGEQLYVGSAAVQHRWPMVFRAFEWLRNDSSSIETFNRSIEKKIRTKSIDGELLRHLATRPGEFARRIDFLLRNGGGEAIVKEIPAIASKLPSKLLFQLAAYLKYRIGDEGAAKGWRVFLPKGTTNKAQVVEDKRQPLDHEQASQVVDLIETQLILRFMDLPKLGAVYIDPALYKIVMPFNRRGDSATTSQIIKGSRYPMGSADVIRLFAHWTGNIDVDLSFASFDSAFKFTGHIGWTNLQDGACVHSGDVQNAPKGASEFIDFDIDQMLAMGGAYAVAMVISYRGETFNTFPCFAGFMERDAMKSGRKYEPQSVRWKFDIKTPATAHMPLVFDFKNREVIFTDLSAGRRRHMTVEGPKDKTAALLRAALDLSRSKPTIGDVLRAHAIARGSVADSPDDADKIYALESLDIESVMAMMNEGLPA